MDEFYTVNDIRQFPQAEWRLRVIALVHGMRLCNKPHNSTKRTKLESLTLTQFGLRRNSSVVFCCFVAALTKKSLRRGFFSTAINLSKIMNGP